MFVVVTCWSMALACLATDPYDIERWGLSPRVEGRFAPDTVPFIAGAVIGDTRYDVLVLGGSTLVRLDPADVERSTGGKAFNLSYSGPRPLDRQLIFRRVLAAPHLKRVIVSLDWFHLLPANHAAEGFPYFLLNGTRYDDLRGIGPRAFGFAWDRAIHGRIAGDPAPFAAYLAEGEMQRRRFLSPAGTTDIAAAVEAGRGRVTGGAAPSCRELGAVDGLRRFARDASGRGLSVTVLIPPVSLYWYSSQMGVAGRRLGVGEAPFAAVTGMWRCTVLALDGLPGVTVAGFDDLDWITGDLNNYYDAAHLHEPSVYRYIARGLDDPARRLVPSNIDAYVRNLASRVGSFTVGQVPIPRSAR